MTSASTQTSSPSSQSYPGLADGVALGMKFGEPNACSKVSLRTWHLVQHDAPGAPLSMSEQPDGRLEGLIPPGESTDLGLPCGELLL
jgi:hypothetical protein